MQKVIIDSDWGGDVLQLSSLLLARPQEYRILGATVTFGNSSHDQNLLNAGSMLKLMNMDRCIPRFPGARAPDGMKEQPEGDGAHGLTGLGKIEPELPSTEPASIDSVDFILETIASEPADSVIIVATGPQTNIAKAIRKDPVTMQRTKQIRIMGGCTAPIKGYRVDKDLNRISDQPIQRFGNITEYAEFNFQQAPDDAMTVLKSGIQICLFPMNCTHQMTFTNARQAKLAETFQDAGAIKNLIIGLHSSARFIDFQKFGIAPTLHDVHTTASMIRPELYTGRWGTVDVVTDANAPDFGYTSFEPNPNGLHWVADTIKDPDAVFDLLIKALKQTILYEPLAV
ncbi:MAG: nucleoside hydrolase [Verrucomicrobiota bacterium]